MKKTKKILSGLLAVLMLVSMLSCFTLPTFAEGEQTTYYVASRAQWVKVISLIEADANKFAGKTVYIQCDIDYKKNNLDLLSEFAGTLDGNGYSIVNVGNSKAPEAYNETKKTSGCLVKKLTGTIQNLTIESSCYFQDDTSNVIAGAFAAQVDGGTIKNCAFYGKYTVASGKHVSGFVGKVGANGLTIDGCIFKGTVINNNSTSNTTAAAFVGYKDKGGAKVSIRYSLAMGTTSSVKGTKSGMVCAEDEADIEFLSSYYFGSMKFVNGAANSNYKKNSIGEAIWTINFARETAEGDQIEIYFSVDVADQNGKPYFGSFNDRVVQLTIDGGTPTYYAPRGGNYKNEQTEITITPPDGKTPVVSGAEYRQVTSDGETTHKIYVGYKDITVTYENTVSVEDQNKDTLQRMIAAYEAMEGKGYVSDADWPTVETWMGTANAASSVDDVNAALEQEPSSLVKMKYPNYPSIKDYNTFKYSKGIKDYAISTADEWIKAVEMSNYVENPNAVNFADIKMHLTTDIDMGGVEMLPLCYGWVFDGNLDGHNKVFKSINIKVDNAFGPVGLIGAISMTKKRTIENLGIASGSITVTGNPRYKSDLKCREQGNKVGGFVGKAKGNNTVIRKCWNNANIYAKNIDVAAGIIADARNAAVVDSCFNLGTSTMQTSMYGIMGYSKNSAKIFNSMSGGTGGGLALETAYTATDKTNVNDKISYIKGQFETYFKNISGVVKTMEFTEVQKVDTSGTTDEQKAQDNEKKGQLRALEAYDAEHTVLSDAEAAWKVNANYTKTDYGDQIYYALNENGEVRFGRSGGSDQIYRIKLVCIGGRSDCEVTNGVCTTHNDPDKPVYTYGSASYNGNKSNLRQVTLDAKANYYASPDAKIDSTKEKISKVVTIKENVLSFTDEVATVADSGEDATTFTVYVGYDADRGNVHSKDETINVLDVLAAVKMAVATNEADKNKLTADLNNDYTVDINDAYQLVRHVFKYSKTPTFTPGKPVGTEYLKVLTYNVKALMYDPHSRPESNPAPAMCRYDAVLAELEAINADIIGLQEIDRYSKKSGQNVDQLQKLASDLDMDYYKFNVTDPYTQYNANGGGGNGILSRYPIVQSGVVSYEGKYQEGKVNIGLDGVVARGFTWAEIDVDGGGYKSIKDDPNSQDIIFYNCHFSDPHDAQIQYMINYMKANHLDDRVVCTGDFNFAPYKIKSGVTQGEPYTFINGGKYFTSHTKTNASSGSLVDNILVSDNVEYYKPLPHETGLDTRMGLYGPVSTDTYAMNNYADDTWSASDHLPVWAYIKK